MRTARLLTRRVEVLSGEGVLLRGEVLSKTGSDFITPPLPSVDKQTGVKTLPCVKLRLQAVIIHE